MPLAAAAIIGGGALLGGALQSGAAGRAADKAAGAARYQADQQLAAAREEAARQEPWRQVGLRALPQLESYAPVSMQGWEEDPYNLAMLEAGQRGALGMKGKFAERGSLFSGDTLRALVDYGKQNAGDRYSNIYNIRNQQNTQGFNRLASLANIGQVADRDVGQNNLAAQRTAGDLAVQGAATQAQAGIAQGQMWGNTLGNLGNAFGNYYALGGRPAVAGVGMGTAQSPWGTGTGSGFMGGGGYAWD
jgi:hypothetical protein